MSDDLAISVTDAPSAEDLKIIGDSLTAFNQADVGPANREPLAVLVRERSGRIVAGLSGHTAWGWLYVQWLWVAKDRRGQRLAGRMLVAAEDAARVRGCHGAYIDTFSPVALRTYQRAGYEIWGELKDFPKGRTRTFLQKPL